jgi:putative spermidine/putrescine transport system ATP-binding protein
LGAVAAAHSLRLDRVRKTYGTGVVAVDRVSLEVPRGEFLTLLGPSGSGKTTLLMMVAGFVEPTEGEVLVDERPITRLPPERRNFGMVFQGYALFPHMTAAQNIAYPLEVRGFDRATVAARVGEALALVRLQGLGERRPRELSGGQQQRVAIARALVFRPDVLLLDEPLGALDRKLRAEVQLELKALHARLGTTFLYVTHDQEEALSMSDRVAIMDRGRVVQTGRPAELYERPRTRFVADFLGRSNVVEGTVVRCHDGEAVFEGGGGRRFLHRGGGRRPARGSRASFALRPERVSLAREEPPAGEPNRVRAAVAAVAYMGATVSVVAASPELGRLEAALLAWQAPPALEPGAEVWLSWAPEATVALEDDGAAAPGT